MRRDWRQGRGGSDSHKTLEMVHSANNHSTWKPLTLSNAFIDNSEKNAAFYQFYICLNLFSFTFIFYTSFNDPLLALLADIWFWWYFLVYISFISESTCSKISISWQPSKDKLNFFSKYSSSSLMVINLLQNYLHFAMDKYFTGE